MEDIGNFLFIKRVIETSTKRETLVDLMDWTRRILGKAITHEQYLELLKIIQFRIEEIDNGKASRNNY